MEYFSWVNKKKPKFDVHSYGGTFRIQNVFLEKVMFFGGLKKYLQLVKKCSFLDKCY